MQKLTQVEIDARLNTVGLERMGPYVASHKPLLMRCQNGHELERIPAHVFRGVGCRVCAGLERLTQEQAEERFRHRGVTLLGQYINFATKASLRCDCGHEWRATPANVLSSSRNCPTCALKKTADKFRLPESTITDRLKNRGIELLEPYRNASTRTLMRGVCGHEWRAKPGDVFGGTGCKQCAKNKPVTQDEAIRRYRLVGLEMLEPFKGALNRILARCVKCNREWLSMPNDVFGGHGCGKCAPCGFQKDKAGTLYYVRVPNPFGDPVYKIGITNLTLRERFGPEFSKLVVIETWHFPNGAEAFEMEQDVLNDHDADRYTGPDILKTGNDELFNLDVLGLDRGRGQLELVT
jgi:hypothetical protein